ncbi:hypothetical protein BsWGS_10016 [Bradybaena similaris]
MFSCFVAVEQENDLLVCGDCQTSFPLQDIIQFIKHKKQFCDKENVDATDGACRKPGSGGNSISNNNNEVNGDRNDDSADDNEDAGDMSKSLSRRDVGDDDKEDFHDESDDDSQDTTVHNGLVNGDKDEASKAEEKSARRDEKEKSASTASSAREQRPPLRQKQMADAESNTIHSEPSRFVCETCRSTYTSAWALLQHAQKEHGMKIYTSFSSSSSQHHLSPCSASAPTPSTVSPMELVVRSSPRSGMDHRSVSTSSGGSISPYPVHTPNPFASPFRLPLDSRLSHPNSLSPFSRSPNIDFDVMDSRLRPQLHARGTPGLDHPLFLHSPFDRARPHLSPALESHYDYYSMRLKQLANSPVVTQTRSPFLPSSQPRPPSITVPTTSFKPDSPPADVSSISPRGSNLISPLTLPPKQKACEFCGKHFRFQSNLVVHRRSHTGEKPYKCPKCPHACTQQSKLKRHMKTHCQKADGTSLPNGMSNHKEGEDCIDYDDDDEDEDELDEDEEEEEEEEECEDEDDLIEEEMNEEEREVLERMKETKKCTQNDPEPGEICHEAKRIKLEQSVEGKPEEDNMPSDLSMKSKPTESLLSEVMKKSGLNDIQTYSEAYKAALAESQEGSIEKMEDKKTVQITCLGGDDARTISSPKSPRHGVKREFEIEKESEKVEVKERLFLGGTDLLSKHSKRDSSVPPVWSPTIEPLPHNSMDPATLYSRLHHTWFAENQARLFFPGYAHRFPHSRNLSITSESHNGLNLSPSVATTSSALKCENPSLPALFKPQHSLTSPSHYPSSLHRGSSSSSSSPTGSLLMPNSNSGGITPPRKESRRNDTCEFCGKVFKNCSNLTVHRRSHTGEKPYKCNLCSYACAQSSKLTRHMKTHGRLGKDVYTCKFCNMPFSVPSTLEKHMRKCVENRNAGILSADAGDISSESNGEMSCHTDCGQHLLNPQDSFLCSPQS